jgi:hypothetical protein
MNPELLLLFSHPYPKIRLGKDYDGGYVIHDIPEIKYDILISGGIDNDISFEEKFCEKYKTECIAFDGTIDNISNINNITHIKKNIDTDNNLSDLLKRYKNIFIKMDIEGSEFEWIKNLEEKNFSNIVQMVIEFHYPSEKENEIFEKINKYFVLVHFHANNYCGYRVSQIYGVSLPNVFECTYINKKYIQMRDLSLNSEKLPTKYDMRNIKEFDDYLIDYPPFVFL